MAHSTITFHGAKDFRLESYNTENSNSMTFIVEEEYGDFLQICIFDLPDERFQQLIEIMGDQAEDHSAYV